MLIVFARVPVAQASKLKCLTDDEVMTIRSLYTVEFPSVWLGWSCDETRQSGDAIPSPDCVVSTQTRPTVIRRATVSQQCCPCVASLHNLLDCLQPVFNASSCVQSLWLIGDVDLDAVRVSTALYGACLRLTLGLGAALTLVGVDAQHHHGFANARVWCDLLRCNFQLIRKGCDADFWTTFRSTLLWTGPVALNNVSLMHGPLHLFNFSLLLSNGPSSPSPSDGASSNTTDENGCNSCTADENMITGEAVQHARRSTRSAAQQSVVTTAGKPAQDTADSSTSSGSVAGKPSSRSSVLPRSNSATCPSPNGLESWILASSRHCYVDVQRCVRKQAVLHCPVDQQCVSLSTCSSSSSSSRQFLNRLSSTEAGRADLCLMARLCRRPVDGEYGGLIKAAERQSTYVEWIAEHPPDAIGHLQTDLQSVRNRHDSSPSPTLLLQGRTAAQGGCANRPENPRTASASLPTPAHSCLQGWVMKQPSQIVSDLHSTLDRLVSTTPNGEKAASRGIDDHDIPRPDAILLDLAIFDPQTSQFSERLDRHYLLEKCMAMRPKVSDAFGKLLVVGDLPEMAYLKYRHRSRSLSSSSSLVSSTPTGTTTLDPPIFSDSVKVGQFRMEPSSTVAVKRLLAMFNEDGSVACLNSLEPVTFMEDASVSYNSPSAAVRASHAALAGRHYHGVEFCRDGNGGLQRDARLHKLRDGLNRVIDPTSSAVELKAALSDQVDMLPTPTGHVRAKQVTSRTASSSQRKRTDGGGRRDSAAAARPQSASSATYERRRSSLERLDEVRGKHKSDRSAIAERSSTVGDVKQQQQQPPVGLRRHASVSSGSLRRHSSVQDASSSSQSQRRPRSVQSQSAVPVRQLRRESSGSAAAGSRRTTPTSPEDNSLRRRRTSSMNLSSIASAVSTGLDSPPLSSVAESVGSVLSQTDDTTEAHIVATSSSQPVAKSRSISASADLSSSQPLSEKQLRIKRSERHKQKLQLIVEHVVIKYGVPQSDPLFQKCATRLFKVSKIFLEDLTTSHNLVAEMKKVAKNNVKQVVQSEFKNAKKPLSSS